MTDNIPGIDEKAIGAVKANILSHDFLSPIQVQKISFFDITSKVMPPAKGVIVLNPPYGKRLEQGKEIFNLYHETGKKLISDFKGWRLGVICPDQRAWKALRLNGLKPGTRHYL